MGVLSSHMVDYGSEYRAAFPLFCYVDILDAHDYRESVFEQLKSFSVNAFAFLV
jgi:hypothetical protein